MVPPGTNAPAEPLAPVFESPSSPSGSRGLVRLGALALGLAFWAQASDAQADIYRYVDKDGVIHFSNVTKRGKLVAKAKPSKGAPSVSGGSSAPSSDPAKTPDEYDAYIREAASLYQIPEALVRAVIRVESNFDPRAISRANAQGLMQLIPATAERMLCSDPFDARQNVLGGTRYLRVLANLFNGNLQLTLAAYNAGEGAVIKYNGIPPYEETQAYVSKVLEYYNLYRGKNRT
ncbi:MAG TPA: lytic transglycosylase domain-containing protein [Polyangiaceae bacterium]|nr:lytic transglycosylase domain-containing protein [Polyangiaceae bacterium]